MKTIGSAADFFLKYGLNRTLGEGGYGTVYLYQERETNQTRAVKIISGNSCINKTWCAVREEYLPNELVLWEKLSHPNIAILLEVYREKLESGENTWFFVMEYDLDFSEDLCDYTERYGALDSKPSAEIIRQLVKVVYYLTMQNIDHRDLKDENILYNPRTNQIRLIDFGSCGELTSESYTQFLGTPNYVPPEYFTTGSYRAFSAAVWGIGCVAYILLSGDCPFHDLQAVQDFQCVEELNPACCSERTLRLNFIKCCLQPDPEQRLLLGDLIHHPWLDASEFPLSIFDCLTFE